LSTRVIWAFREVFNGNLTMMALKDKKLHPNNIQGIRDFTMTYKSLVTFTMAYKELVLPSFFPDGLPFPFKLPCPADCSTSWI
jgi:hypothetical protein